MLHSVTDSILNVVISVAFIIQSHCYAKHMNSLYLFSPLVTTWSIADLAYKQSSVLFSSAQCIQFSSVQFSACATYPVSFTQSNSVSHSHNARTQIYFIMLRLIDYLAHHITVNFIHNTQYKILSIFTPQNTNTKVHSFRNIFTSAKLFYSWFQNLYPQCR
jgi:hypothetical protein